MDDRIISTRRGLYGRLGITVPLPLKIKMLAWAKKAGMKKAEFLRLALITGFVQLSKGITPDEATEAPINPPASASEGGLGAQVVGLD